MTMAGVSLATESIHAQNGLDISQIQFNMPSALIQGLDGGFVGVPGAQQRRHQRLALGAQFTHRHALGACS